MKQIQLITAILLSIKEFETNKFSIYNITASIRDHLNMRDYEIVEDGRYPSNLTHQEVKDRFEELWDNGLLSNYDKSFNSSGYREYQLNDVFDDDLDLSGIVGVPTSSTPPIKVVSNGYSSGDNTPTIIAIKDACTASKIPFDIQKKMYQYIKNNGPVNMKRLQSRLKGQPYTCKELKDFLAAIGLIDPQSSAYPDSQAFTVKFD